MAAQFSKPHDCQLAGSSENVCLLRRELFLPPLQHSPPIPWAGTLASQHQRQGTTKIVYLINATSREPEVGILAEMQQGRKKFCLDPSGSPQPHLHASERALSSSCFFYQAHRHSKLVRLDSSVNVGYSQRGCCRSPASPVPLSPGRHPPTSTWPWINTALTAPTERTT